MAVSHGFGKIVTDGLVLALDAADTNSYTSGSTTWRDMSGNGNNGTLTNGPTFDSANGGSIVFDGVDDYGQFSNIDDFQVSSLTIDIWTKILEPLNGSSGFKGFFSTIQGSNGYQLFWNSSTQWFYFYSQAAAINTISNSSYSSNTVLNISCTFNTSNSLLNKIFINGIDSTHSRQATPLFIPSTLPPRIGGPRADNFNNYFLEQELYSVRFYNRVLTDSEILQNYNTLKPRFGL